MNLQKYLQNKQKKILELQTEISSIEDIKKAISIQNLNIESTYVDLTNTTNKISFWASRPRKLKKYFASSEILKMTDFLIVCYSDNHKLENIDRFGIFPYYTINKQNIFFLSPLKEVWVGSNLPFHFESLSSLQRKNVINYLDSRGFPSILKNEILSLCYSTFGINNVRLSDFVRR